MCVCVCVCVFVCVCVSTGRAALLVVIRLRTSGWRHRGGGELTVGTFAFRRRRIGGRLTVRRYCKSRKRTRCLDERDELQRSGDEPTPDLDTAVGLRCAFGEAD